MKVNRYVRCYDRDGGAHEALSFCRHALSGEAERLLAPVILLGRSWCFKWYPSSSFSLKSPRHTV